jgi:uncharacterized protein (DUF58 family)
VGVIFFSKHIEKFIVPKKGASHILRIIRELIEFRPSQQGTNLTEALRFLTNAIKKRCTAFLLSDFYDHGFEDAIKIAGKKHDLIALHLYDERETNLPEVGLIHAMDAETGKLQWIDTSDRHVRLQFKNRYLQHIDFLNDTFRRSGVDSARISTDEDYTKPLMNLFRKREARR